MAALIFDSPVFTHVSNGPSDKGRHQPMPRTGDTSAGKLIDHASTAMVRGSTGQIANALARWKRPPSVGGSHATVTKRDTLDATFIAAETTHAAVLYADMRGYTGLAEQLPPARVVSLLDEFFTILGRIIVRFGGQVFHIAGDGMMAGFGVRDPSRSGARAALAAGDAMLQRFAPVATRWRDEFEVVTGIGIGLHLGEVALGFLGPPGKKAITLIGDTANVAARLCGRARAGEMLFSCAVAAALVAVGDGPGMGPKSDTEILELRLRTQERGT
jgi:class 3 adenylate cyclase